MHNICFLWRTDENYPLITPCICSTAYLFVFLNHHQDPGKLSELTDAEKIILNSLSAQTPCLSNYISNNTTAEINHSDDHNNQSSHEESENETQQCNSKATEEVYNADARTKLDISQNFSESENEIHQNNSNVTEEINIIDGRSNLHISNHFSESENETQQNNSDVTEEINNKDGRSNLHISKHISESENETQQNNSYVTEEINNKDGHSNLHISKHISESENETQQNNSNVTDEINVKDGGSNLHISNHFSESENETQQNNSNVTEEINDTDGRSNMDISDHFSDSENETQQSNLTVTEKNNNKDERNSYDMSNNFKEATAHLLDVIIEESGESSYASSESLVSGHTEEIPVTNTERSVVNNDNLPKTVNQGKVPVRQIVPNIETDNKFDKCYSLEEADSFSDSSSNSMLRKLETDSDVETVKSKSDSNARDIGETQSLTYQEETCSTDLLHHRESYCETSFGTCDMDGGLSRWNSKRKGSRHSRERKESLEQRLRRRFTIHDEHKQEVAKRIIALVIKYSLFVFNFCSWVSVTHISSYCSFIQHTA